MKANRIISMIFLFLGILTFLLVLTNFNPHVVSAGDIAIPVAQATTTPLAEASSEIGSTDGILVMGIVIVLIVTLPLVFKKRK